MLAAGNMGTYMYACVCMCEYGHTHTYILICSYSRRVIDSNEARRLVKGGKPQSLFQEPLNESGASRVCEKILPSDSFVPYELVDSGSQMPRYLSSCPCMADGDTERRVYSGSICRGRRGTHPMPFSVRLDRQLERYTEDLSWLDSGSLADVPGIVADGLGLRQLVDYDPAWIDEVCSEVESRAADDKRPGRGVVSHPKHGCLDVRVHQYLLIRTNIRILPCANVRTYRHVDNRIHVWAGRHGGSAASRKGARGR